MPFEIRNTLINHIASYEEYLDIMYQDSKGKVTVGMGFNLQSGIYSDEKLASMGFVKVDRTTLASLEEIKANINRVMEGVKDQAERESKEKFSAGYFKPFNQVYLPKAAAEKHLPKKIEEAANELRITFSIFDTYPKHAQMALVDMMYTLGRPTFEGLFEKLSELVKERNWKAAAEECRITSHPEFRNEQVKRWFLEAERWDSFRDM